MVLVKEAEKCVNEVHLLTQLLSLQAQEQNNTWGFGHPLPKYVDRTSHDQVYCLDVKMTTRLLELEACYDFCALPKHCSKRRGSAKCRMSKRPIARPLAYS